ncbi:hypothetical protein SLEP1_g50944 [Rubroshorea leprosula]|uniref:Uncharacterized protein n=1 Tax=Rubroshorea leprosula TaxID=152421 RepID=A0AAV5M424_9ROSI|nr:hypothetical protein SLEP1_g50944 [Rubroshorea leprosula]
MKGLLSGFASAETKDWKPQTEVTSKQQVHDFWLRSGRERLAVVTSAWYWWSCSSLPLLSFVSNFSWVCFCNLQ